MLEIHVVASGDVACPTLMVIAATFCRRKTLIKAIKKLIKAIRRRIRGRK